MPSDDELRSIYENTKTIAVVGASSDQSKPAHNIPAYLQSAGFRIIPVSPKGGELFGETVHTSLADIDEPVDVVDVFVVARHAAPRGVEKIGRRRARRGVARGDATGRRGTTPPP